MTNSYTQVNVSFNSGEGTGLTSFGIDTPLIMSIFTDDVEINNRITTAETKIATLQASTQNITSIGNGYTAFSGAVQCTYIEAVDALTLESTSCIITNALRSPLLMGFLEELYRLEIILVLQILGN